MTTPQNVLHNIEYKLKCLLEEFYQDYNVDGEEETLSLIDSIRVTMKDIEHLKNDIEVLKNTMALILKVMNEKGNKK